MNIGSKCHVLLKPGLDNVEHYIASFVRWVQLFSSLNILWHCLSWDWNENWCFPVLWPLLSFPDLLAYWVQDFHNISFRIWNSSTGILSPPLALFAVKLPKPHLTSHYKMSGSRWVTTRSCLSGSWRSFLYSFSVYSFFLFVVNFVIHWNETAMDTHVFQIPIPPPTSLSTRSV